MPKGASVRDENYSIAIMASNLLQTTPIYLTGVNLTNANPLHVAIVDGTGTQITSFGGGTQYTDGGTPPANPVGPTLEWNEGGTWRTVSTAKPLPVTATLVANGAINLAQISGTTASVNNGTTDAGTLRVTLSSDSTGVVALTGLSTNNGDTQAFINSLGTISQNRIYNGATWDRMREIVNATDSTGLGITAVGVVGQFDDVSPGTVTENRFGNIRMSVRREMYQQIRDAAGNERGANVDANNNLGVVLPAETTKVIGVVRTADGSGNLLSSTTNALDVNLKTSALSNLSTNVAQINGVTPLMGNGVTGTGSLRVTIASDNTANTNPFVVTGSGSAGSAAAGVVSIQGIASMTAVKVAGNTAAGSSISAAPLTAGGRAATANPTAVTDGQVVNAMYDKLGKAVVVGSVRDLKGKQTTTITASTAETTIVTQIASTFIDIYGLILANTGATATSVQLRDTTAGTVLATFQVPAGDTRGFMLPESAALAQTTVNTNWTAQCGASTSSLIVTALYVKNI